MGILISKSKSKSKSKEELLYEKCIEGDIEGIKSLSLQGAGLEYADQQGMTPLSAACLSSERYALAETLIELGANVNAYRRGQYAGTPLHHAAERGLDGTVKLLLSHGANPFLRNDYCRTPLDVAKTRGFTNVARLIESRICFFSGWLMEFYGPGFLGVYAPKLLSTKIWVVVIPHALPNPAKPLELELLIYSNSKDAQPRAVVPLWKGEIEEPKLRLQVLTLMIFDKPTGTRYKFAASNDGDKQQIQSFYVACRGTPQVTQASAPTGSTEAAEEPAEEALAINASLQSAAENRLPPHPNHNTRNSGNLNSRETSANNNSHNGWGPASESSLPETSSNGWTDEPPKEQNNGWALSAPKPNHSTQTSRPDTSNVWANSVDTNVARLIESPICFFSGWLMEFYGPGFLEVFAPKLLSTKIWVVVIPHALPNPAEPLELELLIYSNFQDAQPRAVVPLWKGDIEEPKLRLRVLTLMIFDKPTGTRYKFAASNDGDKQQIKSFYLACRGTPQVTQASAPTGSTEAAEEALATNASLQSAAENRLPPHPNHNTQNSGNLNSWETSANNNSHNGWGSASESSPPETTSDGWTDEPPKEQNNGWELSAPKPNHSTQTSRPDTSNVCANSVNNPTQNEWVPATESSPSKASSSGWIDELTNERYNGWELPDPKLDKNTVQANITRAPAESSGGPIAENNIEDNTEVTYMSHSHYVPSAPPIPMEGLDGRPIHYKSIDFSHVDFSVPSFENKKVGSSSQLKDKDSSCVICLDAPVEGACVPCGHMAGCMACLNEIKTKKGHCPVCRAKITQVIRLFAV